MSPIEQRIAIAKACGWDHFNGDTIQYTARNKDGKWGMIPEYESDLNAMHEAEVMLAEDLMFNAYESALDRVVPMSQRWILATAAQRAEAFLRTIGKWVQP